MQEFPAHLSSPKSYKNFQFFFILSRTPSPFTLLPFYFPRYFRHRIQPSKFELDSFISDPLSTYPGLPKEMLQYEIQGESVKSSQNA